jgi:hypothetical protein
MARCAPPLAFDGDDSTFVVKLSAQALAGIPVRVDADQNCGPAAGPKIALMQGPVPPAQSPSEGSRIDSISAGWPVG